MFVYYKGIILYLSLWKNVNSIIKSIQCDEIDNASIILIKLL